MTRSVDVLVVLDMSPADWDDASSRRDELEREYFEINRRAATVQGRFTTGAERITLITIRGVVVGVALTRSLGWSGDVDKRIRVDHLIELRRHLAVTRIIEQLSTRFRKLAQDAFESTGKLGNATAQAVLEAAGALSREFQEAYERISAIQERGDWQQGSGYDLLREQRDALALGLEIAGLDSNSLLAPASDRLDPGIPFLQGLDNVAMSEAAIVRHDAWHLDEWQPLVEMTDVVTFVDPQDPSRRVSAFYADKEGLEHVTGSDLIYYNHHAPGFVLVQYKRMKAKKDTTGRDRWGYRPDTKLADEIKRMRYLASGVPQAPGFTDWRLSTESFYIKLVEGDIRRPDGRRLAPGMYFPVSLFELLTEQPFVRGPKGGIRIGWHNAKRYLSNSEFVDLLRHGWVGSAGDLTPSIAAIVRARIGVGRGVTVVRNETDGTAAPLRRG